MFVILIKMAVTLGGLVISDVLAKDFNIYWNIPTFQCKKYKLPVVNVTDQFGIIQNTGDTFRGDKLSILYDPGSFPALLENSSSTKLFRRNGGVPQAGNLNEHFKIFQQHVDELIPDKLNDGLAIIDFESWRPVYRQNFGILQPYKDVSEQLVRNEHWLWPQKRVEAEASRLFEEYGRVFVEKTIELARQLRPNASWGYYGLPYCFNGRKDSIENCPRNVQNENDETQWIYDSSDIIYPSVYMTEQIKPNDRPKMVRGRVRESMRLSKKCSVKPKVIAYHRYVFTDTRNYLSEADTLAAISTIKSGGADGVVLWGSSSDLNTKPKCEQFFKYLDEVLGPVVRSFIGKSYFVEEVGQNVE